MVFSSVPLYLDPPTWNQQQLIHQQPGNTTTGGGGGSSSSDLQHHHQHQSSDLQHHHQHQHQQQQLQPLPTQQLIQSAQPRTDGPAGQSQGQARPNSMADRARMAKIPQPEQALKCPRCDSTNTKFCYFNNYSLSQPRHFCKTCRRYWTRGGALRNVPVGGGCRRNKRSKSTSTSKSSTSGAADRQAGTTSSSSSAATTSASLPAPLPQMQFLASLHHPMIDYAPAGPNIELGFSGMQQQQQQAVDYSQLGEQWRMNQIQQFPFLGGLEAPSHLQAPQIYPFDGAPSGSELITQLASVKMEDNPRGLNLARQYNLGMNLRSSGASDQFWAAGSSSGADQSGSGGGGGISGWMTNLSVFNSSSTGSLL